MPSQTEPPIHAPVDPERTAPKNSFDTPTGYSGQDYHRDREQSEGERHPSGEVNPDADRRPAGGDAADILPPDNGRRAFFDPATGEVHGAGVGAGGGNAGEDFASDPQAGSGYPRTGKGDETTPIKRSR